MCFFQAKSTIFSRDKIATKIIPQPYKWLFIKKKGIIYEKKMIIYKLFSILVFYRWLLWTNILEAGRGAAW